MLKLYLASWSENQPIACCVGTESVFFNEPSWISVAVFAVVCVLSPTQILDSAGAESGDTRDFARSNLAVLKQESGDFVSAVEEYREVLT